MHFAYVLVQNGLGGVTERRIAVSTDTIGTKAVIPAARTLLAPPQAAPVNDFLRQFVSGGSTGGVNYYFPGMPSVKGSAQDTLSGTLYPPTGSVSSSTRGDMVFAGVPAGTSYQINCSVASGTAFTPCDTGVAQYNDPVTGQRSATSWYVGIDTASVGPTYTGHLQLADGSPCGSHNEFFGKFLVANATLLDGVGASLGAFPLTENGDYNVPANPLATSVRLNCAGAPAIALPVNSTLSDLGTSVVAGVTPPTVLGMTATLGGVVLNDVIQTFDNQTPEAIFLPPPKSLPSDILQRPDAYLGEKGVDTALGGCMYYLAIGAVTACSKTGAMTNAISFQDWKRTVQIDSFAVAGTPQYSASYINQMDLNLMRVHESISYSSTQTAAYVCNHLGPAFTLVTPQAAIDTAISNGVKGKNLVACVAMDYGITPGVNGGAPFTRFLIFGPSGQLLPSINLDGRREKFVPGTCVACHGGDHYAGKFPEDGSGQADVGAHFLPYDAGNFEFSSTAKLTEAKQELSIYHLNQNVLKAGPTPAEVALINGWYAAGHTLNKQYLPPSWQAAAALDPSGTTASFYVDVLARSCRSCHVALRGEYNFDNEANADPNGFNDLLPASAFDISVNVCGGDLYLWRDYMMPNSLVTYNKMWLTYLNTATFLDGTPVPDQISTLEKFFGDSCGPLGSIPN